jgi:hypothetical protein
MPGHHRWILFGRPNASLNSTPTMHNPVPCLCQPRLDLDPPLPGHPNLSPAFLLPARLPSSPEDPKALGLVVMLTRGLCLRSGCWANHTISQRYASSLPSVSNNQHVRALILYVTGWLAGNIQLKHFHGAHLCPILPTLSQAQRIQRVGAWLLLEPSQVCLAGLPGRSQ